MKFALTTQIVSIRKMELAQDWILYFFANKFPHGRIKRNRFLDMSFLNNMWYYLAFDPSEYHLILPNLAALQ